MTTPMLSIRGLYASYGKIEALRGIDLDIAKGEIVALIGANGAGKSTLMMTICGSPQARSGAIIFDGEDITRQPTHLIARRRIAQSPEGAVGRGAVGQAEQDVEGIGVGAQAAGPGAGDVGLEQVAGGDAGDDRGDGGPIGVVGGFGFEGFGGRRRRRRIEG